MHRIRGLRGAWFSRTYWTVVLTASAIDSSRARDAFDKLLLIYWPAVYAYLRAQGKNPSDAGEQCAAFLARIRLDPEKPANHPAGGKFRTFVLSELQELPAKTAESEQRSCPVPADTIATGEDLLLPGVVSMPPEAAFNSQWAAAAAHHVLYRLEREFADNGKRDLFLDLRCFLTGSGIAPGYSEVGAHLRLNPNAVKTTVLRLRHRHRDAMREEVAHTISTPPQIDPEMHYLTDLARRSGALRL